MTGDDKPRECPDCGGEAVETNPEGVLVRKCLNCDWEIRICSKCGTEMTWLDDNSGYDPWIWLCEKCGHEEKVKP